MDLYRVIGNPVSHSQSPWIHTRFAALTGQTLQYDKQRVPVDGFVSAVQQFFAEGGRGCNVTVPFKFEAAALATQVSDRAQLAQAANTLTVQNGTVQADNTDGAGLVNDIQRNAGFDLAGRRILLIGAGGASAGVLAPLIQTQPASITVANRTVHRRRSGSNVRAISSSARAAASSPRAANASPNSACPAAPARG